MTPDQVTQAHALLDTLTQLRAQQTAFSNATSFQIQASGPAGNLGTATFPAEGYASLVTSAFDTEITGVINALTALGVTGV